MITESAVTEHDIAYALAMAVREQQFADQIAESTTDDEVLVESARSFSDAGVLTINEGIVVRLADGSEYQITIVRSR